MLIDAWNKYWGQKIVAQSRSGRFAAMLQMPSFKIHGTGGPELMEIRSVEESAETNGVIRLTYHGDFPKNNVSGKYVLELDPEYCVIHCTGVLTGGAGGSAFKLRGPFAPDFRMSVGDPDLLRMYSMNGGASTMVDYPPRAYAYRGVDRIYSLVSPLSGLSTEGELPFAIITDEAETCGFVTAMEYSGRWIFFAMASANKDGNGNTLSTFWHQRCGLFQLSEGEEAVVPGSVYCFYKGTPEDGSNRFRRYFQDRVRAADSALMPVFYNHFFYHGNNFDEKLMREEAEFYAAAGAEYFVVDGGWYSGGFRNGIGNWETPDPENFPSGLRAFSDYVRSLGMKFGLWFEPEFAMADSDWCKKYPQYYMDAKDRIDTRQGCQPFADRLFRMDLPEARDFIVGKLTELIREWGVEWVRFDFNNAPGAFWDANEQTDQFGLLENHYCAGVYDFMDRMKKANPGLQIESCAGGGHRMDFGMLRRSDTAWMSDRAVPCDSVRRYQANLNRFVPGMANSVFITKTPHPAAGTLSFGAGEHAWSELLSKFAGPLGLNERGVNFSAEGAEQLKEYVAVYKKYRHYLVKDFYPVCDPGSMRDWDGWQFHDPETDSGIAAFFRCRSGEKTFSAVLRGLESGGDYEFTAVAGDAGTAVFSGGKLAVTLENAHECVLFNYRRKC